MTIDEIAIAISLLCLIGLAFIFGRYVGQEEGTLWGYWEGRADRDEENKTT